MAGFWDERFDRSDYVYGEAPCRFLVAQAGLLAPGARVLMPGDGEGRNGVWLAEQGCEVVSLDASAVGLAKARSLAQRRGVALTTLQADLRRWTWPVEDYDAVVSIFLHFGPSDRAAFFKGMAGALRPGGLLIFEAFRVEQLGRTSGGPKDEALLYRASDLAADFAGFEMLLLEEVEEDLDEGAFHKGAGAVVHMVARKPA